MRRELRPVIAATLMLGLLIEAHAVRAAVPAPEVQLGACQSSMASAQELFPGAAGPKILVVRFGGADAAASEAGRARAQSLSEELVRELRQDLQKLPAPVVTADALRVRFVPCLIVSAQHAREVGRAFGADLVLWGQSGAAQLDLSLMVVRWKSQPVVSGQLVRRAPDAVLNLEFPRLPAANPLPLHRALLAIHAYWFDRHPVVVEALRNVLAAPEPAYPSDLYRLLGRSLILTGKPREGQATLDRALALCRAEDAACRAIGKWNLAWATDWFGDPEKATEHAEQAVALAQKGGDRWLEAMALYQLADVVFQYPEATQSLVHYRHALRILEELNDLQGQAELHRAIGFAQSGLDRQSALVSYEKALSLSLQLADRSREAQTRVRMAALFAASKELPKAAESIDQALALWRQLGSRDGEAHALLERSKLEQLRGEYAKAADSCEEARAHFVELGRVDGQARALECKGAMAEATPGAGAQALGFFEQAFALARQAQHLFLVNKALRGIGRLFRDGGDQKQRNAYYDRLYFGDVRPKSIPWGLLVKSPSAANASPYLPYNIKTTLACGTATFSYRYCVNKEGLVENILPLRQLDEVDRSIEKTLASWRFAPRADVVCAVQAFAFEIAMDAPGCADTRARPRFASQSVIAALRLSGETQLPWTGSPPLAPGKSLSAVYRMCYKPDGSVSTVEKVRTIDGADAQISAALRQHRIQEVQVPLCTFQSVVLSGPAGPASDSPPLAQGIVPAMLIHKQALHRPDPHLPDEVKALYRGGVVKGSYKICLKEDGLISSADPVNGIADADEAIVRVVLDWRFKPIAVPICFLQLFEFHIE